MTMLEEALKAAAKGWEVFPIRRGTKSGYFYYPEYPGEPSDEYPKGTPYSWKAQASKDPERVRKFWTDHPDANIGVATGQRSGGLFIVDEDEKNNWQGIANYEKWIDDNTLYLDEGVMVKTPSGGRHEYYTATEEIVPTREGWLPGVDIRGENNGYVLLPPSYYEDPEGEHTGFYEWISSPEECSILSDKDDPNIVYLASSIAKNTYGLVFDPDGNPVPFTAVNGEVWEGRKTEGTGRGGNFPRNEDGKIPHGVRHEYIVHRTGYFVAKLKDTGLTPEAIQQIVLQDFRENCEEPDNVKKDPAPGILRDVKKWLNAMPDYEKDPNWKQYCVFAWRAEHGGEEWNQDKAPWEDVAAAGLRAKDEQATLEQLRAKVPGRKKQPEQPAGGADPGEQQPQAQQETPPEQPKTPAEILQDFRKTIASRKYEPIKTGIPAVDRMFGGGLIRGTLVTLQAAPGMGKTTLAQWIFENMAAAGNDVLYINLEMDREQLLARSIARIAWRNYSADFDALEILRAYQFENDTIAQDVINRSIEDYTTTTAPRLTYNPEALQNKDGTQSNHIDRIMDAIQKEADRVEAAGRPTPIICIDYLQIIKTDQRDPAEGVKEVLHRLKDFAARPGHQTTVFLITAQNRAANSQGEAEQESGRDTSDIEYTADIMLAITYTAIEDHEKFTVEDAKGNTKSIEYTLKEIRRLAKQAYTTGRDLPEVCKRYTLKVNKHRFAAPGKNVKLIFDGRHSMFETVKTWNRNAEGQASGAQRVGMKKK